MNPTKTVIITGTSRGIGFELVHLFANSGYSVLALSRNARPVSNLNFENITALSFDLNKSEDYEHVEAFVQNEWSQVDILINNAGTLINKPFSATQSGHLNLFNRFQKLLSKFSRYILPKNEVLALLIRSAARLQFFLYF